MCRCISHSPVPLNNEQRFKFAMSTYTWLPAIVISAGLVFCETSEWNDHGAVTRAVNQHQNEPKPTNSPKPTN